MHRLTRTRAYWGPFLLGMLTCLLLWGVAQTNIPTGGWVDLVPGLLLITAAGAVSAVVARPSHAAWGGALAGLAGLLASWVVINLGMGYVAPVWTVEFATFLGVITLLVGCRT
jgi:hypothetical protein